MKNTVPSRLHQLVFPLLVGLLLCGCAPAAPSYSPAPSPTLTASPTRIPRPTRTVTPTSTVIPTKTVTPTPAPITWDRKVWAYCKGEITPFAEAPEIVLGQGVTEFQYYYQNTGGQWVGEPTTYRHSETPQVVICAVPVEANYYGSCDYKGGYKIEKYSQRYHVLVYATRTGELLLDLDELFPSGDYCPQTEVFSAGNKIHKSYDGPTNNYLQDLLARIP